MLRNQEKTMSRSEQIPIEQRRFDSLAWLIQGDDICGAACFDGERLLLATNNDSSRSGMIMKVMEYLSRVAEETWDLMGISELEKRNAAMKAHEKKIRKEMAELVQFGRDNITLMIGGLSFDTNFCQSLEKLTRSIRHSYLYPDKPKGLPIAVAEAIRSKKIKFIKPLPRVQGASIFAKRPINLHAELKIVQDLIDNRKLSDGQKYYIGVSKKCCLNCEKAIQAVNEMSGNSLVENILQVRDSSGYTFNADAPPFLIKNKDLQKRFLKLRAVKTLAAAFEENPDQDVPGFAQLQIRSESADLSTESAPKPIEERSPYLAAAKRGAGH